MSRQTVTIINCDFCGKEVEEVIYPGELSMNGSLWKFDACLECSVQLTAEMTPIQNEQSTSRLSCGACGKTFKNERTLHTHEHKFHEETIGREEATKEFIAVPESASGCLAGCP